MQRILRLSMALLMIFSGKTYALFDLGLLCPYVGADIQVRHVNFPSENGGNLFKKNSRQANLYFGTKLCSYFGFEVGYETSVKTSRVRTLYAGSFITGTPVEGTFADFNAGTRFSGWHVDALGYLPLSDCYPVELIGSVGVINLKTKLVNTLIQDDLGPLNLARNFVQTKPMLRLMAGLQYTFMNCLGIRASVGWQQSNRFKNIISRENFTSSESFVRVKNSFIYGIGGYVYF